MILFLFFSFSILLLYISIILSYIYGWYHLSVYSDELIKEELVTVVIVARNEGNNIEKCLNSIYNQVYKRSNIQLIVVDDNSVDDTKEKINKFILQHSDMNVQLISLDINKGEFSKKVGITKAITFAKGEIIICTDADCLHHSNWIKTILKLFEKTQSVFITGPVFYKGNNSFIEDILNVELASLMGITGGSIYGGFPMMSNGANMAFKKSVFESIGGYHDNLKILSGDDQFLMLKIREKYPKGICFVKSRQAIVSTNMPYNSIAFINQRVRWASKTNSIDNWYVKLIGLLFVAANIFQLIFIFIVLFNYTYIYLLMFFFCGKLIVDFMLVFPVLRLIEKKFQFLNILIVEIIYPFYILIITVRSIFGGYSWKGRYINPTCRAKAIKS